MAESPSPAGQPPLDKGAKGRAAEGVGPYDNPSGLRPPPLTQGRQRADVGIGHYGMTEGTGEKRPHPAYGHLPLARGMQWRRRAIRGSPLQFDEKITISE